MTPHFHSNIESVIFAGIAAILVINLVRMLAGLLAARSGIVGQLGSAIGATVHFG